MRTRCLFGHHAAVARMQVGLRGDDVGLDLAAHRARWRRLSRHSWSRCRGCASLSAECRRPARPSQPAPYSRRPSRLDVGSGAYASQRRMHAAGAERRRRRWCAGRGRAPGRPGTGHRRDRAPWHCSSAAVASVDCIGERPFAPWASKWRSVPSSMRSYQPSCWPTICAALFERQAGRRWRRRAAVAAVDDRWSKAGYSRSRRGAAVEDSNIAGPRRRRPARRARATRRCSAPARSVQRCDRGRPALRRAPGRRSPARPARAAGR